MPDVLLYEKEAWASGFLRLAGIDEAGRGPLAGPVVAAAVMFDSGFIKTECDTTFIKLTDSKAMNESLRDHFFDLLFDSPHATIGVGIIEAAEIDQINILKATHKAMTIAVGKISPQFALVDGLPVKGLPCASRSIVKGDSLCISISAASVIAKVTRDRIMQQLDGLYPEFGFSRHKGYGTSEHLDALKKHGPTPVHRRTFRPVAELGQLGFSF